MWYGGLAIIVKAVDIGVYAIVGGCKTSVTAVCSKHLVITHT